MVISKDDIFKEAVNLSPMDKAQLVETILSSFNFQDRLEIDLAWAKEAENRLKAIENGEMETVSMEEVFSSINN
ncbi:MAG: addiction module protein [Spirochaetales bacterium]|uniref:Addiction module protein n=1 Tax=Candidatus Thalassospirochaeta sargassi TaxID=3119039 RepID=A0AAJ1MLZ7_9SPIO|nr:addiction module protein [Spirochaetales bacterium]